MPSQSLLDAYMQDPEFAAAAQKLASEASAALKDGIPGTIIIGRIVASTQASYSVQLEILRRAGC